MEKTYKLTQQGLLDLQNEIERLKTEDRQRNLEALKEARAQGDLSENADYDAARDEQAQIEARIKEIEQILKDYEIIKEDIDLDKYFDLLSFCLLPLPHQDHSEIVITLYLKVKSSLFS